MGIYSLVSSYIGKQYTFFSFLGSLPSLGSYQEPALTLLIIDFFFSVSGEKESWSLAKVVFLLEKQNLHYLLTTKMSHKSFVSELSSLYFEGVCMCVYIFSLHLRQ